MTIRYNQIRKYTVVTEKIRYYKGLINKNLEWFCMGSDDNKDVKICLGSFLLFIGLIFGLSLIFWGIAWFSDNGKGLLALVPPILYCSSIIVILSFIFYQIYQFGRISIQTSLISLLFSVILIILIFTSVSGIL